MKLRRAEYKSPGEAGRKGFEDLDCYRLALDIVVNAYALAKELPVEEKYDLATQIRRSAKSITANFAEGYGRYHYLDSLKFYSIARGEMNETLSHFINARVLGYIDEDTFNEVYKIIRQAESALNGFITYVRKQKAGHEEYGDRAIHEEPADYLVEDTLEP